MSSGIKVVVSHNGERGSVGVSAPGCDPVFATVEGDLGAALERVTSLVEDARARWGRSPRYPKCELPLPPPVPEQRQPVRSPQRSPAARPPSPQQSMF